MSKPYNHQLIDGIVKAYEQAHGSMPFSKADLAVWAIREKLWDPPLKTKVQLLSDELGSAMGTSRKNYGGRKVRQYHCIQRELEDGKQQTLWCHIDIATPEFLEQSVSRRRRSQRNQNIQLHNDVVHINETKGTRIQLLFDYTDDIADYEHALKEGRDASDQEDLGEPEK
jgi:hypothetical protein